MFGLMGLQKREPRFLCPPRPARDLVEDGAVAKAEYAWAIGEPAALIADTAKDYKAQLVVVGHTHHGFLGKVFGADVSAEVQKHAGCPVEVVD